MDKELLTKLRAIFKVEAEEHVNAISSGLVELERASSPERQMEIVERVFREAHSLKGAARAVNLVNIEGVCQSLESLFEQLKSRKTALSAELFDHLHGMADALGALLAGEDADSRRADEIEAGGAAGQRPLQSAETAVSRPPAILQPENPPEPGRFAEQKEGSPETLRVSASKLESLLRRTEELIPMKAAAAQRLTELREIDQMLGSWETEWRDIRRQAHTLPSLTNEQSRHEPKPSANGRAYTQSSPSKLLAFLDRNETALSSVKQKLDVLGKRLEYDRRTFERAADDLLEDIRQVSMLPFSTLLESFPKLVRDLGRDCGKDAELTIVGGEIEIDRRILQEMKDPLIHMFRNCIDHGIETPDRRKEKGKQPRATIRITISLKSAVKVEIAVSDDGAGLDLQKVRAVSAKLGIVAEEDAGETDEQRAERLIFKSGFSTSPMVTEISGRGLGLAIVREKTERVGGTVSVESQPGAGTTFRLTLPLTLARFRGILVRVGESLFVLPTRHVQRVLRVSKEEIKTAENCETIRVNGRPAPAVRLSDIVGVPRANIGADPQRKLPVLVLVWAGEQIGFFVDEILDEREILVKSLGKQLSRVRNIAGATILGTGQVLPVLDVADLMKSAVKISSAPAPREAHVAPKCILVAEDSITSRTLLKNILELAGYKVKTAVDGAEALNALTNEAFDLVVSDVEMPRMSGFDLTAKIRAGGRLAHLPVVLVTGLDSRQDRERGVEVGANAYIVKSSFDQGNLLEVVRRLI